MVDELSKKLEPILRAHGVQLAYLFGSQATGQAGPLSDFDVGVLWADTLSPQERFRHRLHLIAEMTEILRVPRMDVVVLNEAPPALRFKVIQEGKILYNQDETARVRFEAKTMSEYFDTQPLRDLYRQRLFEAITAGRFYD